MQTQTTLAVPAPVSMPALITPPMPTSPEPSTGTKPMPLILFGRDESGRAHAACAVGIEPATVERAASLMGLTFVAAETQFLRDLGAMLPTARIFESGRAFVPFVKATIYDRLLAATGTRETPPPVNAVSKAPEARGSAGAGQSSGAGGAGAGDPPATRAGAKAPGDHSQISLGSLVLAKGDEDDNEGYFAAKVIATKAGDSFVLTWTDYPDLPEFARSRKALALLHPETAAEVE